MDQQDRVERVRAFNRFYTKQIGLLQESLLHSPYTLSQGRILFELAQRDTCTAAQLCRLLNLDKGYLSRMLSGFVKRGLMERLRDEKDGRQNVLQLTPKGREEFGNLNRASQREIAGMLANLSDEEQGQLTRCMDSIELLLGNEEKKRAPILLRNHRPGDMGYVTHRHGALYFQEYGWDETFEALVAQVTADFVRHFDRDRETCIIAEQDGEIVGSAFVVKLDEHTAKLRLLYVEPKARGLGLGSRLVSECIAFARRVGYKKMTLWTNSVLVQARRIYDRAGFVMTEQESYHGYGKDLVSETWEMAL